MYRIIMGALIAIIAALNGHAWAANYSNPIDGNFKGVYGDTISVQVPSLVHKSPVNNDDQNGDLSFQLSPETGYRNFHQLTDLKYGDPVRIEYNEDPTGKIKQMVARKITKLESENGANTVSVVNANTPSFPANTQTVTTTTTTRINSQ